MKDAGLAAYRQTLRSTAISVTALLSRGGDIRYLVKSSMRMPGAAPEARVSIRWRNSPKW